MDEETIKSKMITIQKARKILGSKYDHIKDEEVQKLINFLTYICNKTIDEVVYKKHEVKVVSHE